MLLGSTLMLLAGGTSGQAARHRRKRLTGDQTMSLRSLPSLALLASALAGTPAIAAGVCNNASLTGSYAFHAEGQNLGILDSSNVLHPFKAPEPFTGVGEYLFDGNGSFTRIDYNTGLGAPSFPLSPVNDEGFRTDVSGTYSVSEDCTATFTVGFTATTQIILAVALVDYGQRAFAAMKSEHVSAFPSAGAVNTSDLSCDSGCNLGVQFTAEIVRNSTRAR